jgi:signal transduction histidine kinase/CheY-like chemotaxis protein
MTQSLPIGRRVPDRFLLIAMLLLVVAGIGQRVLERERGLAAAHRTLETAANACAAYLQLGIGTAMRRLDAVAAVLAAGDSGAEPAGAARFAEPVRLALASVPGARFAVLLDAGGKLLASAGQPDAARLRTVAAAELARLADPLAPAWHISGPGSLLLARRMTLPGGGFGGIALLAIGPDWLDRFVAGLDLGPGGGLLLLDAERRLVLRVPSERPAAPGEATGEPVNLPAAMSSNLVEIRPVLPGLLELAAERSNADVLRVWRLRSVNTLAVLAAVLAMLLTGWWCARQRILRLQAANQRHIHQFGQLAIAAERLSRLRDVGEIVARAEAIGRSLLGCERLDVTLGEPAQAPAGPAPGEHGINLLGSNGERLGRIALVRADGGWLSVEDDLVLEQFARAVASALESATLLADTMRAKSELEQILSTLSDGMLVLDRGWRIRHANAAAGRYLQHRHEAMLGANVWDLLPGLRDGEAPERLEAAVARGQDAAFTSFYPPLNAWFEIRAFPFAGGLTVYFRDVTVQRETEEKLRQAQKLEAVGQMTGGIAHDVNNMLTVIMGNLELLAMRAEDRQNGTTADSQGADAPDGTGQDLDLALAEAGLRAGESASQLMHRLLVFSRHTPLARRAISVGEQLQGLQPLLRRTLSEQVSLRMHWPPDLWPALADPSELESAIVNLAINAQDAMPGGGTLTIEASNVAIDRMYAAVAGLDRTGDYVMISVLDTGTGMPTDVLARVFDPFFTTKAPGKGSGLGLSMVYGFVRQSDGHVLVDSAPGLGTMVRLYLPRTLPEELPERHTARPGPAGGGETILLVEDNELVRTHTDTMLRGLGYQVVAAPDGPAAMQALAGGLRPDLLLTDVILPGGMTGRDVAEAAQHVVPGLRVLFISGYAGDVLMENGRLPPGVDLLGKPFRRTELAVRIRAQLAAAPAPLAPAAHAEPG